MAILEVNHIEKHFENTKVLEDISFSLEEGKACPGQGKRRFETGMNARILHIMRQRICGSEHGCRFMW